MNRNRKLRDRVAQPHMPKCLATKPRTAIKAKTKAGTCGGQRIKGGYVPE